MRQFTAIIEREGDEFVSLCPELDIASCGKTIEEAKKMLAEAIQLFLESASTEEIAERMKPEVYITTLNISHGQAA